MKYRINEIFTSVKGEGLFIGTPMHFVRLAHCSVSCDHCDTKYNVPSIEMAALDILQELVASKYSLEKVVITGGEPTDQNLEALGECLTDADFSLHLETSGIKAFPSRYFDWVCVSPKLQFQRPLDSVISLADEIKMPISTLEDIERAEEYRKGVENYAGWADDKSAIWYLHPWNSEFEIKKVGSILNEEGSKTIKGYSSKANEICIEHAKKTGRWRVSVQAHKIWQVK